jgi:hypothetical protein
MRLLPAVAELLAPLMARERNWNVIGASAGAKVRRHVGIESSVGNSQRKLLSLRDSLS